MINKHGIVVARNIKIKPSPTTCPIILLVITTSILSIGSASTLVFSSPPRAIAMLSCVEVSFSLFASFVTSVESIWLEIAWPIGLANAQEKEKQVLQ